MVLLHSFKFFFGQFCYTCLLKLLKSPPYSLITDEHSLADISSRASDVVDFSGDQNGSSTQAGRSTALAHPVPLHTLDEFDGSMYDLLRFAP